MYSHQRGKSDFTKCKLQKASIWLWMSTFHTQTGSTPGTLCVLVLYVLSSRPFIGFRSVVHFVQNSRWAYERTWPLNYAIMEGWQKEDGMLWMLEQWGGLHGNITMLTLGNDSLVQFQTEENFWWPFVTHKGRRTQWDWDSLNQFKRALHFL